MSRTLFHRLLVLIIHLVYRFRFFILSLGTDHTLLHGSLTNVGTVIRLVGDALRNDILCTRQCIGCCRHFVFFGHIVFSKLLQRLLHLLKQDQLCKRLQSALFRDHGTGTAFRAVRTVQIVQRHHGHRILDLFFQLRCQLFLITDGRKNLVLLFLQIAQVTQTFIQITKHLVV